MTNPRISPKRKAISGSIAIGAVITLAACGFAAAATGDAAVPTRTVTMRDLDGNVVGTTVLVPLGMQTRVTVSVHGQTPGYHGFHVHAVGLCEPDSAGGPFLSAGGHFVRNNTSTHGEHAGDLPPLYVGKDGHGAVTFETDAFRLADLLDADGSAVMLHAGRDNLANIPLRYAPGGPDADTKKTGDAGGRVACGALTG